MVYIPSVPENANEAPSASQPKITENFQELDRIFGKEHTKFSEGADGGGKHKFLTMPKQTDSTRPATGENEGALYLKEVNSKLNLFLRQQNSGTETNVTERDIEIRTGDQGKIVLNNNLIIIWGNEEGDYLDPSDKSVQKVDFHTPFKNDIFWVNFNVQKQKKDLNSFYLDDLKRSFFLVRTNTSQKKRFFYLAIGR